MAEFVQYAYDDGEPHIAQLRPYHMMLAEEAVGTMEGKQIKMAMIAGHYAAKQAGDTRAQVPFEQWVPLLADFQDYADEADDVPPSDPAAPENV